MVFICGFGDDRPCVCLYWHVQVFFRKIRKDALLWFGPPRMVTLTVFDCSSMAAPTQKHETMYVIIARYAGLCRAYVCYSNNIRVTVVDHFQINTFSQPCFVFSLGTLCVFNLATIQVCFCDNTKYILWNQGVVAVLFFVWRSNLSCGIGPKLFLNSYFCLIMHFVQFLSCLNWNRLINHRTGVHRWYVLLIMITLHVFLFFWITMPISAPKTMYISACVSIFVENVFWLLFWLSHIFQVLILRFHAFIMRFQKQFSFRL